MRLNLCSTLVGFARSRTLKLSLDFGPKCLDHLNRSHANYYGARAVLWSIEQKEGQRFAHRVRGVVAVPY